MQSVEVSQIICESCGFIEDWDNNKPLKSYAGHRCPKCDSISVTDEDIQAIKELEAQTLKVYEQLPEVKEYDEENGHQFTLNIKGSKN